MTEWLISIALALLIVTAIGLHMAALHGHREVKRLQHTLDNRRKSR